MIVTLLVTAAVLVECVRWWRVRVMEIGNCSSSLWRRWEWHRSWIQETFEQPNNRLRLILKWDFHYFLSCGVHHDWWKNTQPCDFILLTNHAAEVVRSISIVFDDSIHDTYPICLERGLILLVMMVVVVVMWLRMMMLMAWMIEGIGFGNECDNWRAIIKWVLEVVFPDFEFVHNRDKAREVGEICVLRRWFCPQSRLISCARCSAFLVCERVVLGKRCTAAIIVSTGAVSISTVARMMVMPVVLGWLRWLILWAWLRRRNTRIWDFTRVYDDMIDFVAFQRVVGAELLDLIEVVWVFNSKKCQS